MNDLGMALVWLIVQVTIVAFAGLGLSAFAGRRTPGAGGPTALTALAATVLLAALACCPLPKWWAWEATLAQDTLEPTAAAPLAPAQDDAAPDADGLQLGSLLARLHALGRGAAPADAATDVRWTWPAAVMTVVAAGTGIGFAWLLLGLWRVHAVKRRSRPVTDAAMVAQVAELGAPLGVRRPVAIRESAELASAATIGWRRPILLLPTDWRDWTVAQQRAAVAHELAHVRHADFAAWLLAQLGVAVYFWHPLVRVLAGRLQLQQELAADAAAAQLAGGRAAYLRALAELALNADGRANGWPAPAFLSRKGTLLRRIAMLRVTDDGPTYPRRRIAARLTLGVVCACTLAVSAWRFPAQDVLALPPKSEAITPFDPALVVYEGQKNCDGFYGVRPAALLNRPGTAPLVKIVNKQIDTFTVACKAGGFGIHIEDIDQIMGRLTVGGEKEPGKRTLMASLTVLRTTRDIDWVKLRDDCGTLFKKHEWKGDTYVSFPMLEALKPLTGGRGDMYLWAADARTLVMDGDRAIKKLIERKASGKKAPVPAYAEGWDKVSRGLLAIALDNRDGRLLKRCITEAELKEAHAEATEPEAQAIRLFEVMEHFVVGFAGDDDCRLDLHAWTADADGAARLAKNCSALVKTIKGLGDTVKAEEPMAASEAAILALLGAGRATVQHQGTAVTVHAEAASGLNTLFSAWTKELTASKK